jgi:imidazole glycerol-phosphate synthase subunit HisH
MRIGIIDYGMGNIASVQNALTFLGYESEIINTVNSLSSYDKLILPGVGAFPRAMQNLKERNLIERLNQIVIGEKRPILGLCLGLQLFFEYGYEDEKTKGLSWIEGEVLSLKDEIDLTVPHMGWNDLIIKQPSLLLNEIQSEEDNFYFVHSYYCKCTNDSNVIATVEYGVQMDVVIQKDNIYGCQFHPEKSQKSGLKIIKNFLEI